MNSKFIDLNFTIKSGTIIIGVSLTTNGIFMVCLYNQRYFSSDFFVFRFKIHL